MTAARALLLIPTTLALTAGWSLSGLSGALAALAPPAPDPPAFLNVSSDPLVIDPRKEQPVSVIYRLTSPARVTLRFWDGSDRLVRTVIDAAARAAGEHRETWDGKDHKGRIVPDEAYVYTLEALGPEQTEPVIYDVTDLDRGSDISLEGLTLDVGKGVVSYTLRGPSRVVLRVSRGREGPLARTLVNWEPRATLYNEEPWDGWDASHAEQLTGGTGADPVVHGAAYLLPRNTVVVTGGSSGSDKSASTIPDLPERRRARRAEPHLMYQHSQHPADRCSDPPIRLRLAHPLPPGSLGTEGVPVQVAADPAVERFLTDQRAEIVFYVDGVFAYEEELGYLPFTWNWRPQGLHGTEHVITVNLLGYEGHFGIASLKVLLPGDPPPGAPRR